MKQLINGYTAPETHNWTLSYEGKQIFPPSLPVNVHPNHGYFGSENAGSLLRNEPFIYAPRNRAERRALKARNRKRGR